MSGAGTRNAKRFVGWLAVVLFLVFCANIVVAKLTGLAGSRVILLSDLAEFFVLHAATMSFIAYALFREAEGGVEREDEATSMGEHSG